jgi:hypothetical protein
MESSFTYAQLIETLLAVVGIIIITRSVIARTTPAQLSAPRPVLLANLNRILIATFILLLGLLAVNIIASLTVNRDCGDQNTLNTTITGNSIRCSPGKP